MGNRIKFNHYNRLYFTLYWLASGIEYRQMEFFFGWSKSQFEIELRHILKCIVKGLDPWLQWPTAEERQSMANTYDGIFKDCVGIADATEQPVRKSKNKSVERATYSGKQGCNTYKSFAIIDRSGRFRYVVAGDYGGMNDRDQFTSTELYRNKQQYFDGNQFICCDGIYRGDGPVLVSYNANQLADDMDGSKADFNLSYTEYRKGVENAFGRVQKWFPLFGNQKYEWDYDRHLYILAFQASCRLHNWMLHIRDLDYDPTTDPSYLFTQRW
jgi:hypothetical protein